MQLGKIIETNICKSLNMAGVSTSNDFELDVHKKVDCMVDSIDGKKIPGGVAVQITMNDDLVKAKVAKLLALSRFSNFIYLLVKDAKLFEKPSVRAGEDLKRLILNLTPIFQVHPAIAVEIGRTIGIMPL